MKRIMGRKGTCYQGGYQPGKAASSDLEGRREALANSLITCRLLFVNKIQKENSKDVG
jgi:hypothetical protein